MSFKGLTLIESTDFVAEKTAIEPDVKRMDEILFMVTHALSRCPEHFEIVPGTKSLHRVNTDPFPDAPKLRIWYTFTDTEVTLLSIEKIEEE